MKALFRNRWFLGALISIALSLLIFYIGPAVAIFNVRPLESSTVRLVLIFLVFAIWLGIEGWRVFAARRANQKLIDGIAGGADADPSAGKAAQEVELLRQRFQEAAVTLRNARFEGKDGEKQYLYQLPWYMFIGAPGSGKTTALINSGLRFPISEGREGVAVKGVGGTRNCDWWFTDEAVLLDTAGRYSTQESDQKADAAAWLGFLDLLKRNRPRRPLNGAIITVSVLDLLSWSDAERARYCDAVRQRVQELYTRLGVRFPLYVMVTKCDLLAGFNEFFLNYRKEERAQVWGMTFPLKGEAGEPLDYSKLFEQEYAALEARLVANLLDRLQPERDQRQRALIYNFPQQFAGLKPLLGDFLKNTFQASRYGEAAMLRGVYLTSGSQEGSPIDRVLSTLARSFNMERKILAPAAASGKSFFLTDLLKELIFPEAGLVGSNAKLDRQLKIALVAGYIAVAVVSLSLLGLWCASYFNNRALIAQFESNAQTVKPLVDQLPPPRSGDLPTIFPILEALRSLSSSQTDPDYHVPLTLGMGLYQGDKLGSQAYRSYQNVLRDALLPRIALRLEELMRSDRPAVQYDALKAYLMLYNDKVLEPNVLTGLILADWQQTYNTGEQLQFVKAMAVHLRAALQDRPIEMIQPANTALVETVRQGLATSSLSDRIYSRLISEADVTDVEPFRVSEAAGPAAAQVFQRLSKAPLSEGVAPVFTAAGYYKLIEPKLLETTNSMIAEESWVLGPKYASGARINNLLQIQDDVRRHYFAAFTKAWDDLLSDLHLVPTSGLPQTVQTVRLLSSADSPLKRLVVAAAKEVSLPQPTDVKSSITKSATSAAADLAKRTLSALGAGSNAAPTERPEAATLEHFRALREYAIAAAGARAPIDLLADELKEYGVKLDAVADALRRGDSSSPMPDAGALRADVDQAPAPVRQIVTALLDAGGAQANGVKSAGLADGAKGSGQFCGKAIAGRYPFVRSSSADVTLDDFSKVFAPNGDLDSFFKSTLAPLVDTSRAQWRARDGSSGAPAGMIAIFQRAAEIRDTFFRSGQNPSASGDLRLLSMDDKITSLTFEYDGQTIKFDRGSPPAHLSWPPRTIGAVKVTAAPSGSSLNFDGPWALFRFVDRGNPASGAQAEVMKLSYTIDAAPVVFELRAGSAVNNPFKASALENFRCP